MAIPGAPRFSFFPVNVRSRHAASPPCHRLSAANRLPRVTCLDRKFGEPTHPCRKNFERVFCSLSERVRPPRLALTIRSSNDGTTTLKPSRAATGNIRRRRDNSLLIVPRCTVFLKCPVFPRITVSVLRCSVYLHRVSRAMSVNNMAPKNGLKVKANHCQFIGQ